MRAERRRERLIWSKETDNDFIRRTQFTLGFAGTGVDDEGLERNHEVFTKFKVILHVWVHTGLAGGIENDSVNRW